MADNVIIPTTGSGTATPVIATDDVSSVHYQKVKIDLGGDGLSSPLVRGAQAATASIPVTLATDDPAVAALQILDNAISGSEMQVDVVAALPAGTNNIGDIDVLSIVPGTGATNLGKAEDAAHSSSDVGVMALAVRQATATDLSAGATDGDYEPLQVDANGRLHVNAGTVTVASHAVTNAGTFVVQVDGSALTALQLIDDPIITDDAAFTPATTKVMVAGFEFDDTLPDSIDEGDAGAARMSANRNIYTQIRDAAGNERGVNINASNQLSVSVDNTVTVASHAVTNAGTFAVQDATAQASLSVMDDWDNAASDGASVSGDVAHDSVDAGEPVKIGHVAIAHGTNPTAVAAADRTNWYANRAGVPFVLGGHPNIISVEYLWTTAQTNDAIVTVGAGAKVVVTQVQVTIDEATTVGVGFRIGFGDTLPSAPTDGTAVAGYIASHRGLVPGAGLSRGDGGGILGVGADGENLSITAEAPTSGSASAVISYFTIES